MWSCLSRFFNETVLVFNKASMFNSNTLQGLHRFPFDALLRILVWPDDFGEIVGNLTTNFPSVRDFFPLIVILSEKEKWWSWNSKAISKRRPPEVSADKIFIACYIVAFRSNYRRTNGLKINQFVWNVTWYLILNITHIFFLSLGRTLDLLIGSPKKIAVR